MQPVLTIELEIQRDLSLKEGRKLLNIARQPSQLFNHGAGAAPARVIEKVQNEIAS
jgi:hypothetical protein